MEEARKRLLSLGTIMAVCCILAGGTAIWVLCDAALSGVREPFVHACLLTGAVVLLIVLAGAGFFYRVRHPVISRLTQQTVDLGIINEALREEVRERKSAQEALQKKEELFTTIFRSAGVGICLVDKEGKLVQINDQLAHIYNCSVEKLIGTSPEDFIDSDRGCDPCAKRLQSLLNGDLDDCHIEKRFLCKDGATFWGDIFFTRLKGEGDETEAVIGMVVDISPRKQAERQLTESEEKHRLVVKNATDAIFITQDEWIKFPNPKAEKITGYSAAELIKTPFSDLIHPEDRKMVLQGYMKNLRGEDLPGTYSSFRIKNKAGKYTWVQLNTVAIQWEGRPSSLNFLRDISEQKRIETQFRQSQKMEAVGRLAGGVAHDLNNLMTVVIGNAELMLMSMKRDDPLREEVEQIKKSGERASSLTRQLLAFSRKQVLQPVVCNLNVILEEMGKMVRRMIGEDIELVTNLHPELKHVKIDPSQIEQVIMNLAVNARDAMPQGGRLTIETANVYLDNSYVRDHETVKPGSYVMAAVTDTGEGMEEEIRTKVFDPFFTTKEKGKGTGLGLSTVYGIVKQSDGYIWLYSEPGKGTTFKIYFPEVDQALSVSEKREATALSGGSETILLVEDEDGVRNLAAKVLRNLGYTVLDAPGGQEALELSDRHEGDIDLLLTDVVMPRMSGVELVQKLLPKRPGLKILFMSVYADNAVVNHGMLSREAHLMQKPFTPQLLVNMVQKAIKAPENKGMQVHCPDKTPANHGRDSPGHVHNGGNT